MRRLLLIIGLLGAVWAQRFEWRDVVQTVTIDADGSVTVEDERTLWSDGDFAEAFVCIPLAGNQGLTLLAGSGSLSGVPAEVFTQPCQELRGQELVVRHARRLSEARVRFRYRLEGALDYYSDVVQWYWNLIESRHPPIIGYRLSVRIPGGMAAPYDAFVHRYANPEAPRVALSPDRAQLTVAFDRIPRDTGLEVRYLMDPRLFAQRGSAPGLEALLEDEARLAGIEPQAAWRRSPYLGLVGLALVLGLGLGIWRAYDRVGREPAVPQMRYPFEPPSDLPPAAVTAMLHQHFQPSVMGPAFHATILDLARRGYGRFSGEGRKFEMQLALDKDDSPLEPFEREVLNYLKDAAQTNRRGSPDILELGELKSYSQKHAAGFMQRWSQQPRRWLEARLGGALITPESQRETQRWGGLAAVAALTCGALAWAALGEVRVLLVVAAALCVALVIVAIVALPAWRPEVAPEVYGWQGFRRTLRDYTIMKDAPSDFYLLWDRYFCYAAALGVAEAFLRNLQRIAPMRGMSEQELIQRGSWLGASSLSNFSGFSRNITALSSALSAASASASSGGSVRGGGGGGGRGGYSGGR